MKKILFVIALALPMLASAQKFGYVNSEEVFAQLVERSNYKAHMDSIQNVHETALMTMQEEYNKKVAEAQENFDKLSDNMKTFYQQDIQQMEQRIQTYYQTAQQDVQQEQQKFLEPYQAQTQKAIQEVGKENNFTYIFVISAMAYVDEANATDVTPLVKAKLNLK